MEPSSLNLQIRHNYQSQSRLQFLKLRPRKVSKVLFEHLRRLKRIKT